MSASPESVEENRWRILLLTCRNPETDFRLPLACELQALGHDVTYVFLQRRPTVTDMKVPGQARTYSLAGFLLYALREFRRAPTLLVFNSTNLVFPGLSWILRILCGGLWCFDMHDDLLYDTNGWARVKASIAQRFLLLAADFIVHAAPTLIELFPSSHHLGNASFIEPKQRDNIDFSKVLILATMGMHFDFAFLTEVIDMCPNIQFDLYGPVVDKPCYVDQLLELLRGRKNITFYGPYESRDLTGILAKYSINLAPLITNSRSTRYSDPLRYYHCLNSGMEVISTEIPKAKDFAEVLHIVRGSEEVGPLLERLRDNPETRRNVGTFFHVQSWRQRARQLVDIASQAAHRPQR